MAAPFVNYARASFVYACPSIQYTGESEIAVRINFKLEMFPSHLLVNYHMMSEVYLIADEVNPNLSSNFETQEFLDFFTEIYIEASNRTTKEFIKEIHLIQDDLRYNFIPHTKTEEIAKVVDGIISVFLTNSKKE